MSNQAIKSISGSIYFIGLVLLTISLPFWLLLMSISQFILLGAFILNGNIKEKFIAAFKSPVVLILAGVYIIHLLGLLYSTDLNYALKDLRIKLPLLTLPIILFSMPRLSVGQFNALLLSFVVAVLSSSLCCLAVYLGFTKIIVEDIRDISIFISHVRLSLLVCLAVVCCAFLYKQRNSFLYKVVLAMIVVWFFIFLFILESPTGLAILFFLFLLWLLKSLSTKKPILLKSVLIIAIASVSIFGYYVIDFLFVRSVKPINFSSIELKNQTALGNSYIHLEEKQDVENGNPVWINVCEQEMDTVWNKRSNYSYYGKDSRNHDLKYTLIRFLASKNYTKDAAGVNQLTDIEIKAIENGVPNYKYIVKGNFFARLDKLSWEYRSYYYGGNPSGHSLTQRLEHWKAAIYIIRNNFLLGVGTGDVQQAFDIAYEQLNSPLIPEFRFRAHNEYLTMFVTFGFFGGIYFIFSYFFPFFYMKKKTDLLYTGFLIIALISMLTEDTPESQAGVTFLAFFNSLLLFRSHNKQPET